MCSTSETQSHCHSGFGCVVCCLSTVAGTSTCTGAQGVRVRVNSSVRRAGRERVRVSNQDVVETGYAPSSKMYGMTFTNAYMSTFGTVLTYCLQMYDTIRVLSAGLLLHMWVRDGLVYVLLCDIGWQSGQQYLLLVYSYVH
jgi:hypothetical protein